MGMPKGGVVIKTSNVMCIVVHAVIFFTAIHSPITQSQITASAEVHS